MKKILTALVVTVVTSVSAFANSNSPVNQKVLNAFHAEFTAAVNVSWNEMKGYGLYHASFTSQDQRLDAFFDEEGTLLTTARTINKQQLPLAITGKLESSYKGMLMDADVMEFNIAGETSYYVTLRGAKATLTVKAEANGTLSVFKKEKTAI